MMRKRAIAVVVGLSVLLSACGTSGSSSAPVLNSSSPRPAPTVPANGGLGTWSFADDHQAVTVTFDPKGTSDTAKAAEACRVAMKAEPVLWVVVSAENKTGDQSELFNITIVTGDGHQLGVDNAVGTLDDWYSNAPDSPARVACADTTNEIAKSQIETGIAPGATVVALESVPATVTSVKLVTAVGYGGYPITLAYGS
jgi:hypothetical protein